MFGSISEIPRVSVGAAFAPTKMRARASFGDVTKRTSASRRAQMSASLRPDSLGVAPYGSENTKAKRTPKKARPPSYANATPKLYTSTPPRHSHVPLPSPTLHSRVVPPLHPPRSPAYYAHQCTTGQYPIIFENIYSLRTVKRVS